MRVEKDRLLESLSPLGIGGKADYLILPKDVDELVEAVGYCMSRKIEHVVVGSASGVLFTDKGFRGCVISTQRMGFIDYRADQVGAEAGVHLSTLIKGLAERGLSGLEKLYGIPGTVGGAVCTNAGYLGSSVGDFVHSVVAVDREGILVNVPREDIGFAYRRGFLGGVVVSVLFDLKAFKKASPDRLREELGRILEARYGSQPIDKPAIRLFENVGGDGIGLLIRKCGLAGLKVGGAQVLESHPNYVVASRGAKALDAMLIFNKVSDTLQRRMNVDVEMGMQIIGEL